MFPRTLLCLVLAGGVVSALLSVADSMSSLGSHHLRHQAIMTARTFPNTTLTFRKSTHHSSLSFFTPWTPKVALETFPLLPSPRIKKCCSLSQHVWVRLSRYLLSPSLSSALVWMLRSHSVSKFVVQRYPRSTQTVTRHAPQLGSI